MFGVELPPVATNCLLGLAAVLFLYWFTTRNHDYWRKRGIPYITPLPLFGSITDLFRKPFHEIEEERYRKLGLIYGYYEGTRPFIYVADPELIREVLVKDFSTFNTRRVMVSNNEILDKMVSVMKGDEDWKRIRTIISPTFTTGKIKRMMSIFKDCSHTLVKNFQNASKEGKYIDAKKFYGTFSMDVIASSAFSTKIDSHNDPENQFVQYASKAFKQSLNWRAIMYGR